MSPAALDGMFIDSIDVSKINPNNVRPLLDSETAYISIAISDQPHPISLYGVSESGAARLNRMRTSLELLTEKAGGVLGAVMAIKSARCTSSR